MALDKTRSLHHPCKHTSHPDLDGPALVAADRDPFDHAAHHLAQLRRVSVSRATDRMFDLLRRGLDHRIDILRDVEPGRDSMFSNS